MKKKRKRYFQFDEKLDSPIYPPKLYPCQQCKRMTHNRFKCPTCWSYNVNEDLSHIKVYYAN